MRIMLSLIPNFFRLRSLLEVAHHQWLFNQRFDTAETWSDAWNLHAIDDISRLSPIASRIKKVTNPPKPRMVPWRSRAIDGWRDLDNKHVRLEDDFQGIQRSVDRFSCVRCMRIRMSLVRVAASKDCVAN